MSFETEQELLRVCKMALKVIDDWRTWKGLDDEDPEAEIELHYELDRAIHRAEGKRFNVMSDKDFEAMVER